MFINICTIPRVSVMPCGTQPSPPKKGNPSMLPTLCVAPSWEQGSYPDSPHGLHCPHCPPQSAAAAAPLHCPAYQSAVDWVRLRVSDRAYAVCRVDTHTHLHTRVCGACRYRTRNRRTKTSAATTAIPRSTPVAIQVQLLSPPLYS